MGDIPSIVDAGAHGTYINQDVENIFKSVARTCNSTTINKYNENNTKLENIQEYVKNYVYNTQNENSIKKNLENNLRYTSAVEQTNSIFIKKIYVEGDNNIIEMDQINVLVEKIAAQFEALAEEAIQAINETVISTDTATEVKTAMDNGVFDDYIATCANNMASANSSFVNNDFTSGIVTAFKRIEHWPFPLASIDLSVDIQEIKHKTNLDFVTEDFVTNVCTASLINNTEFFNKIVSAYNQTLNTINKTMIEVNQKNDQIAEVVSEQRNKIEIPEGITIIGDSNKVIFAQSNEANVDLSACAVIKSIAELATTNTTGAMMADILGLTNDFSNKTENKTSMTSENTIWHENQSEDTMKSVIEIDHGASTKKTWFIVVCIICVVFLIAGVIGAIFAGKRKNEKEIREMELKADVAKSAMEHGIRPTSLDISATPNVKDVAKANAINTAANTANAAANKAIGKL